MTNSLRRARFSRFLLGMILLLLVGGLLPDFVAPQANAAHAWEYKTVKGQKYVTARSIKSFYRFPVMERRGSKLVLENKKYRIKFSVGGQTCHMNGVKFIFSFPVLFQQGRYLISDVDFSKLVDPVLRPSYVPQAGNFKTVIIDPGHGGIDSGSPSPYLSESQYTLSLGRELRRVLTKMGYKVVMTRTTDKKLSLKQRVDIANRYKNAIFISLHFNSGGGSKASGIETFTLSPDGVAHYGRNLKRSDKGERIGNKQDAANIVLATAVHQSTVRATKSNDRGIKRARWSVLTGLKHPGILFEGGFLDNPIEARKIHDARHRLALANSIANGVQFYRLAVSHRR